MKMYEIKVDELDKLLKLVTMSQYLAAKLKTYLMYQEQQLKVLEDIKTTASILAQHKRGNEVDKTFWNNCDPELKKVIIKYGGSF